MYQEYTGTVYAANFNDEMNALLNQMFIIFGKQGRMTEWDIVAEAYTTQPNSKASSRVLYNIFESTCGG